MICTKNNYHTQHAIPANLYQNAEERALLGYILYDTTSARRLYRIFPPLAPSDFGDSKSKLVAEAIKKAIDDGMSCDEKVITHLVEKTGDFGFLRDYLQKLKCEKTDKKTVDDLVKIVLEASQRRRLLLISKRLSSFACDKKTDLGGILVDSINQNFKLLKCFGGQVVPPSDFYNDKSNDLNLPKKDKPFQTGFQGIDEVISVTHDNYYVVVAARPSLGKTTFLLNVALNESRRGKKVCFFTLEVDTDMLLHKLASLMTSIPAQKITEGLSESEKKRVLGAYSELQKRRFIMHDSVGNDIDMLLVLIQKIKIEYGLDMVFVDYLQQIKPRKVHGFDKSNDAQKLAEISNSLKELARRIKIPIIVSAQQKRPQDGILRAPVASDIKGSGQIEQDADVIMMLWRPDRLESENVCVRVVKNRNAGTTPDHHNGIVMRLDGAISRFLEESKFL